MKDRESLTPRVRRLEALLGNPQRRAIKRRLGLLASQDAPFFPLKPPPREPACAVGPPDFVGIGAQRAGTSWWFDLLTQHPDVYHPSPLFVHKERHFFSHLALTDEPAAELARQYGDWFPRPPSKKTGEWTPDYMYYSWVPPLLAATAPEAKLLVILRDPIDRFLSGAAHLIAINRGALPPGDVLQDALQRGFYAQQLRRWLDYFPALQLLVLQYESCVAQPVEELARTFRFLELDALAASQAHFTNINAAAGPKPLLRPEARARLAELYERDLEELPSVAPNLDLSLWQTASGCGAARQVE